ncbi:MAG: response regulator [Anaerolineales bacterium]|nr:response regulator [Anaerolineales bacterium]
MQDQGGQRAGWMLLFQDITTQKENERQKAQLAAFEERERIGRDLHDDLGQLIGYFNVQTQAIFGLLGQEKVGQARLELAKLSNVAQKSHADVRRYILGLRMAQEENTAVDHLPAIHADFTTALHHYLYILQTQYGLEIDLHLPEALPDHLLAPASEMQLLRMIQEALHNVRKHAGVNEARLYVLVREETVRAIVEDHGRGFDPAIDDTAVDGQPHFGLQMMHERASTINGTVKIKSQPGKGTKVIITAPRLLDLRDQATPWRILLADDHPLFREGLRNLLSVRGLQVVGIATNGDEAVRQARTLQPDLVLMDIDMPVCNGIEAASRIKAELPNIRIVMLTVSADTETIFAALQAGASGYLLKNLQDEAFYRLLKNIMRGENVVSPELATRILTEFQSPAPSSVSLTAEDEACALVELLTERQKEVLTLATEGLTYKQIGAQLHLSERTIRYHMGQIVETLQVTNRREAVALMRETV